MRAGHIALAAVAGFTAGVAAWLSGFSIWQSLLIYSATGMGVLFLSIIVTFGGGLLISALRPKPKQGPVRPALSAR